MYYFMKQTSKSDAQKRDGRALQGALSVLPRIRLRGRQGAHKELGGNMMVYIHLKSNIQQQFHEAEVQ